MLYFMKHYEDAYAKANEVLSMIDYRYGQMISISDILKTVEKITQIDIKFSEFDFSKLGNEKMRNVLSQCGAAMYISPENTANREARILLNSKETPEMQRFSLVHEMGHILLQNMQRVDDGYLVSAHINMDITSIPEDRISNNELLVAEQAANIFALLVLIPYDALLKALKRYDSLEEVAKLFGVEKDAVISRIMLGEKKGA